MITVTWRGGLGRIAISIRISSTRGLTALALPRHPFRAVPPAVPQVPIATVSEDIDALGAPRRRRWLTHQLATHLMPLVPRGAVPIDAPQLAVVENAEHLHLVLCPGRDSRRRGQLAAQRF